MTRLLWNVYVWCVLWRLMRCSPLDYLKVRWRGRR